MVRLKPFDPDDIGSMPLVHLVSAGAPIYAHQVNRVWRGMVQTPGCIEPAIPVALKFVPSRVKLAIELGCSLASEILNLPVPRGMLAIAHPDELLGFPADAVTLPGRREVLCYASLMRWPDDTAERALEGDPGVVDFLWSRFCSTKVAAPSAAWDELVANADRHTGNFIFDGVRYWLIDHELSLRPLASGMRALTDTAGRQGVIDHRAPNNQVAHQMLSRRPQDHGMLAQPRTFESKSKALEGLVLSMRSWRTSTPAIDDVFEDAETVVRGIILRLPALALHLTERLTTSPGTLKWTPSHDL